MSLRSGWHLVAAIALLVLVSGTTLPSGAGSGAPVGPPAARELSSSPVLVLPAAGSHPTDREPGSGGEAPDTGPTVGPSANPHPLTEAALSWRNITDSLSVSPSPRYGALFEDDPLAGGAVLFGGMTSAGRVFNDTWEFANGSWTNVSRTTGLTPPPLTGSAGTYDPSLGGVLMFGGTSSSSANRTGNTTWLFHNGTWSNLTPTAGPSPPPLYDPFFVYDAHDGYDLLFGGASPDATLHPSQTWAFDQGQWENLTATVSSRPPNGCCGGAVYDASIGGVVIFYAPDASTYGGAGQTWEFQNLTWTRLAASTSPVGFLWPTMAYSALLNASILNGGTTWPSGSSASTWQLKGRNWTDITLNVTGGPGQRTRAMMASVDGGSSFLLFGGYNASSELLYGDTWSLPIGVLPGVTVAASASLVEVGQLVNFSSGVFGGSTGPFAFRWDFQDGGSGTGADVSHRFAKDGTFHVEVTVLDESTGLANSTTVAVTVVSGPAVAFSSSPPVIEVNWTDAFAASATGGFPPYDYAWTFGDGSTASGPSAPHTYANPGNYSVRVDVTDAVGGTMTQSSAVRVNRALAAGLPLARPQGDTAVPVTFLGAAAGGVAPLAYSWTFGDGTGARGAASEVHAYSTPGNFTVNFTTTDALGVLRSAFAVLQIVPPPTVGVAASLRMTDARVPVAFAALASGGTAPLVVSWSFGDLTPGGTGLSAVHAFGVPGTYSVRAQATDAAGAVVDAYYSVSVAEDPLVHIAAYPGSARANATVSFQSTLAGGTGPFSYNWSFGDGATGGGALTNHSFAQPGVYYPVLRFGDAAGWTEVDSITVVVEPAAAGSGPPGGGNGSRSGSFLPSAALPWFVGLGLLVAAAAAVVAVNRRRSTWDRFPYRGQDVLDELEPLEDEEPSVDSD